MDGGLSRAEPMSKPDPLIAARRRKSGERPRPYGSSATAEIGSELAPVAAIVDTY